MITIETKEIKISEKLAKKVEMIWRFTNTTTIIQNGNVRNLKGTNIAYAEPHRIVVNGITYLIFDESNKVFIKDLYNEISINELENHIKTHKATTK